MQVQFILNDDEGDPVLTLTSCNTPELVNVSFHNHGEYEHSVEVHIEDLKLALRKMTTK